MKKTIYLYFSFIMFLLLNSYELNLEGESKKFEVFSTSLSIKYIFEKSNDVLIFYPDSIKPDRLIFLIQSLGLNSISIQISDSSYEYIKHLIDSVRKENKISYIILIGDEHIINPYRNSINPYTLNPFPSDVYYSNIFYDTTLTMVSRIPVKTKEEFDSYITNLENFLFSNNDSFEFIFTAPFYDSNKDSTEDYLYFTYSLFINNALHGSIFGETNSIFPKYTYTFDPLPDSLISPEYSWDFPITQLNTLDKNFIFSYRGHGNTISSLLPDFSLNDINYLLLKKNYIFLFFCCLMGNFDKKISSYERSFVESLFVSDGRMLITLSSSSETFYQYNNYMMNKFFDQLDDNAFKIEKSEPDSIFSLIYLKTVKNLLENFGINDYTKSQIYSYNIFGLPFLNIKKTPSSKPFTIKDTVEISDSMVEIDILKECRINIFSKNSFVDTLVFHSPQKLFYKLLNVKPNTFYYVSSYLSGNLFLDSFFVKSENIQMDTFFFSDESGNNNGFIEERELIRVNIKLNQQPEKIFVNSEDCDIISQPVFSNPYHIFYIKPYKGSKQILLNLSINGYNFYLIFPNNILELKISPNIFNEEKILYKDQEYQLGIILTKDYIPPIKTINLKFIEDGYDVIYDSIELKADFDTVIVWNFFKFHNDTNYLKIEYSNGFIKDTISLKILTCKKFSLFFFDPLENYKNSSLILFLKDTLKIDLNYSTQLDTITPYSSYFFSYGVYPKRYQMTTNESKFIEKLSQKNVQIFVEGGDVFGYDREGKRIKSLFNIEESFDGNTIYKKTPFILKPFDFELIYDTTSGYMDYYTSTTPYLLFENKIYGVYNQNRFAQSPLLKNLKYPDQNLLYYFYALNILDFVENISYRDTYDISLNPSITIESKSENTLLIFISASKNYYDSIKIDGGRFIEPFGEKRITFFVKRFSPAFYDNLHIYTGTVEHSFLIKYFPQTLTQKTAFQRKILFKNDIKYYDKLGRKILKNDLKTFEIYFTESKKIFKLK